MPITFRSTPVCEPLTFDSVGHHWLQERISRPNGYPLYHYLQTETGSGRVMIQGKNYLLNAGEGILIAPFIPHSYRCAQGVQGTQDAQGDWVTLFATFTGLIEDSIKKIMGGRTIVFMDKAQGAQIRELIASVIEEYEKKPLDTRKLSVACYELLLHFVDGIHTHDLREEPLYKRYIEPVIKEIETKYDTALTVRSLSGLVYVTPQYLSRLFGRFMGCSVYEYLTAHRINKAKELLLTHTRMKIQDISPRVGFADTSHFIAVFKQMTGMTPLEFRKLN